MARVRRLLDAAAIRRCFDAYLAVIGHIDSVRVTNDMADLIQYPKLPAVCTQALVRDLIVAGVILADLGVIDEAIAGTAAADVLVRLPQRTIRVEVKATAKDYTELSAADLRADHFVWLDFRAFPATGLVTIYSVDDPIARFGWLQDRALHLRTFLKATEGQREVYTLDLAAWALAGQGPT